MSAGGEILNEEFLKPRRLTANALANAIGVPAQPDHGGSGGWKRHRRRHGDPPRNIFKTSAEFSMNLQMTKDLRDAEKALPARVRDRTQQEHAGMIRKTDDAKV